ncbi:MAG: hypothetical protein KGK11_01780 [Sphingomonadales bacterium]|nr:hypothetical protein [Sphingomonadales bacterium]
MTLALARQLRDSTRNVHNRSRPALSRRPRDMNASPPDGGGSWREFTIFAVKLLALLALIFIFGFVIFALRRALP